MQDRRRNKAAIVDFSLMLFVPAMIDDYVHRNMYVSDMDLLLIEKIVIVSPLYVFGYFLICDAVFGKTLGKYLAGVKIEGNGCLICRELQRLWPVLLFSLAATMQVFWVSHHQGAPFGLPNAMSGLTFAAGIGACLFQMIQIFGNRQPYWDRNTGFNVVRSRSSS